MKTTGAGRWMPFLKKRLWLIVLLPLLSVWLGSFYIERYTTPIYVNTCTLLINEQQRTEGELTIKEVLLYEKLLGTYKDIIMSKRILHPAALSFSTGGITPENIGSMIKVSATPNTQILSISAYHSDYHIAASLANRVADQFKSDLTHIMTLNNVQILDYAVVEDHPHPVKPNIPYIYFVSVTIGLGCAIAIIGVRYLLDTRIRNEEQLMQYLQFPIIGSIPNFKKMRRKTFYH